MGAKESKSTKNDASKSSTTDKQNAITKTTITMNDDALCDGYFPIFKSPYNAFYQCSKNLVEIDISCWRVPPPPMEWNKHIRDYGVQRWNKHIRDYGVQRMNNKIDITYASREVIFDYLLNLNSLNIAGYPFAYISDKIGNLVNLVDFGCYGSNMISMPRTMYKLKKLRVFTPYTSYNLHYLPYEITECPLNDTSMSTGALYNNYKNKMLFPALPIFPNTFITEIKKFVFNNEQLKEYIFNTDCCLDIESLNDLILEYAMGDTTYCSICKMDILIVYVYYIWIFKRIGTDSVGLLGRMCPICIQQHIKERDYVSIGAYIKKSEQTSFYGGYTDDDSLYQNNNVEILQNKRGKQNCVKTIGEYEKLEENDYFIRPIFAGKYFGGEYTKTNVLQSWVYFWRNNLKIDFHRYQLYRNKQTNEVNVKLN